MVNRIQERAARRVCHGDADSIDLCIFYRVVRRIVEVVLAVLLDGAGSPKGIFGPGGVVRGENFLMLRPSDEVFALKSFKPRLVTKVDGNGGINPVAVSKLDCIGIRIPGDGSAKGLLRSC